MRDGTLAPGEKIPSTGDLVESYGCSVGTARQAVELLRREGFVEGAQGRGVFVRRERPLIFHHGPTRYLREHRPPGTRPFQAEAIMQGYVPGQRVLGVDRLPPPAEVAAEFGLAHDEPALVRRHLLTARTEGQTTDVPIALVDSWYPLAFAEHTPLALPVRLEQGADAYMSDVLGVQLQCIAYSVRADQATPQEIDALGLSTGEPVLRSRRVRLNIADEPVQVSLWTMAGYCNVIQSVEPMS